VQQSLGSREIGITTSWLVRWCRWRTLRPRPSLPAALVAVLEQERARWLLWLPVLLGIGIALYFALPAEPPAWLGWLAAAVGLGLLAVARRGWPTPVSGPEALLIGLAAVAFGVGLAQARLHAVAAPVLDRAGVDRLEGRVVDLAPTPQGARLVLDQVRLARVPAERTPLTIRVNLRKAPPDLAPGQHVALLARLQPPLPPALPGAFDFARQAYFEQLGAMGFAYGKVDRLGGGADDMALAVAELRAAIAARIVAHSPGPAGALAAALLTGVRAGIDQATWRQMQVSGLAHLISVSGLHMVLVAGSVFTTCRWLLALFPPLALRFPVKKLAAALALLAAAFYLALTGASVPTQRSFLMTAVALVAVMVDRNPFSLRLLAWSALVVLVLRPESVLGASFQLSFAAVLALVVVYEAWRNRTRDPDGGRRRLPAVVRYLAGVSATTLVASTATMPLGAFHFQTIPTYGVLANLIAVPLTSFVVMPAGLVALLLLPLGWEGPALSVMALGVDGVLLTARVVAGLPGASLLVQQWPGTALALFALGGLWVALWQLPWRWLGLAPCALAALLVLFSRAPDLLVDRQLGMAAVRHADGAVTLIAWDRDRLVREAWLHHLGTAEALKPPKPGTGAARGIACDAVGCIVELAGRRISLAHGVEAALEDCGRVDLVVARTGPERCGTAGEMIGPRALLASGGLAVSLAGQTLRVRTVAATRGDWPWTRRHRPILTEKLN
jgi:competence protein ComEC